MVDFFGFVSCFLLLSLSFLYMYLYLLYIYLFINLLTYCSQIMDSTVNFFNLFHGREMTLDPDSDLPRGSLKDRRPQPMRIDEDHRALLGD